MKRDDRDAARFVQITLNEDSLFALDENGTVWSYDAYRDVWKPISDRRESEGQSEEDT